MSVKCQHLNARQCQRSGITFDQISIGHPRWKMYWLSHKHVCARGTLASTTHVDIVSRAVDGLHAGSTTVVTASVRCEGQNGRRGQRLDGDKPTRAHTSMQHHAWHGTRKPTHHSGSSLPANSSRWWFHKILRQETHRHASGTSDARGTGPTASTYCLVETHSSKNKTSVQQQPCMSPATTCSSQFHSPY